MQCLGPIKNISYFLRQFSPALLVTITAHEVDEDVLVVIDTEFIASLVLTSREEQQSGKTQTQDIVDFAFLTPDA